MDFSEGYSEKQKGKLAAASELADICNYDAPHIEHVTALALSLFDELKSLHHLGRKERFWLTSAGLMHDIGWVDGGKGHHKRSLEIILKTPILPMKNKERLIIGSIARYHCRQMPSLEHDHFKALLPAERKTVRMLSAFLRLADALDHTHKQRVKSLTCRIKADHIHIHCRTRMDCPEEQAAAEDRLDLLRIVLPKEVHLVWD